MKRRCGIEGCERPHSAKGYCNAHYQRSHLYGNPLAGARTVDAVPPTKCSVEGCDSQPRTTFAKYCEVHYMRLYQYGSLDLRAPKQTLEHSGGYVLVRDPGHPLCTEGQSYVYEHRKVFYTHKGRGPFFCHVCSAVVTWADMHVDHLDDDPKNNDIDNLEPACPTCNQWRGRERANRTARLKGNLITAFGVTLCTAEWSKKTGLPRTTLRRRIRNGWQAERALSTPSGPQGRNVERRARIGSAQ